LTTTFPFEQIPWCHEEVLNAVDQNNIVEIRRYQVIGRNMDCRSYNEYVLLVALRKLRREIALILISTYPPASRQLQGRDPQRRTALLLAADLGYDDVVDVLLKKRADSMTLDQDARSVLHLGARWPKVISVVFPYLPDPATLLGISDRAGDQPLHLSLRMGATSAATELAAGARTFGGAAFAKRIVSEANRYGDRPLHLTSKLDTLQMLVSYGASLQGKNRNGSIPFHTVAAVNGSSVTGSLAFVSTAGNGTMNVLDDLGRTPLHYAADMGDDRNCRWLLANGADPVIRDVYGEVALIYGLRKSYWHLPAVFAMGRGTPLVSVVQLGRLDVLRTLVLNGSIPADGVDPLTGRSALFDAVSAGRIDIVAFFRTQNVNMNRIDVAGVSPLAEAVNFRQVQMVQFLLGNGAIASQVIQNGSTALHLAASKGLDTVAEALLSSGSNIDAQDLQGVTPLHLCANAAVANVLLRRSPKILGTYKMQLLPLHTASVGGHDLVVRTLLEWRSSDANAVASDGNTALHFAAVHSHASVIDILLRWCADTQVTNAAGRLAHEFTSDPQTKKKIKDAGFTRDRCQCDCGLYAPGPAYVTIDWQAGCTAKVRCGMTKLASRLETLRCLPARLPPAKGTPVLATWQPARPVFGCIGVSVAARGPYVCISVGVLVLLTVGGLTSTG